MNLKTILLIEKAVKSTVLCMITYISYMYSGKDKFLGIMKIISDKAVKHCV